MPTQAPTAEQFAEAQAAYTADQLKGVPKDKLVPFKTGERPKYYNPYRPNSQVMRVGSRRPLHWQRGMIEPANPLEEEIVRRQLTRLGGPGAADRWKGDTLPNGRVLACPSSLCSFFTTGNLDAKLDHDTRFPDHARPRKAL